MKNITAKNFNFASVEGISKSQLNQHYELYKGYVNKVNEINNLSRNVKDIGPGNATYSKMRSIKLGETYAVDGVKLHELYFENICNSTNSVGGRILPLIKRDFISYENFLAYLKEAGLSMRGWVILAIDPLDDSLHLYGSDAHDVGAVWMSHPLLVMDVYEHAYMIDFGIDKKKYIDTFIKNINWNVVNKRLDNFYIMKNMKEVRSSWIYT